MEILRYIKKFKELLIFLVGSIIFCCIFLIINKLTLNYPNITWYGFVFKPALTPSYEVFLSFSIFIYLLSITALYFILNNKNINQEFFLKKLEKLKKIKLNPEPYENSGGNNNKKSALILAGTQFFFSLFFISVFLGLQSMIGGVISAFIIWILSLLTMYKFYKISIIAAILIIPSVLWWAYLVGLSITFWFLNNTLWLK